MRILRVILFSLLLSLISEVSGQTNNPLITTFNSENGQLVFSEVENATNYFILKSTSLGSGWTHMGGGLDSLAPSETGSITCSVPESIVDAVGFYRVVAEVENVSTAMAYIPGGVFVMGDSFNFYANGFNGYLEPVHSVDVSGFYIGKTEVTKAQWDEVYTWAIAHDYSFDNMGSGKATDHPVDDVSWYDVVTWCNALSEMKGKTPCYDLSTWSCNFNVNGYRLPTEAEWEKAARGNLSGCLFPWGNTISHTNANYYASQSYAYDISSTLGYHPSYYYIGGYPHTSPVGGFNPNGYGLHDMGGNVSEWCWDWDGDYETSLTSDPRGPSSGSRRIFRGGSFGRLAPTCRVAYRSSYAPGWHYPGIGFRVVLSETP